MADFSPKIEIINHFDDLINRIDIDIDSSLEKFNDQELLSELLKSSKFSRRNFRNLYDYFKVAFFFTFDPFKQNLDSKWSESTKVVDYLHQVRTNTIEELKKAQEYTIEHYKLNSWRFTSEQTKEKNIDTLRNELFAERFFFQVNFKQSEERCWAFSVFTFVTDFYMSPSYIDSLEKLINDQKVPFGKNSVFDEKIVLTGLLYKNFGANLFNIPNHVIHVNKRDLLNIESIDFKHGYSEVYLNSPSTIDLSKLVVLYIDIIDRTGNEYSRELIKFNIEGLSSLKKLYLKTKTKEIKFSIKNLPSLREMCLSISAKIDQNILTRLLEHLQHIEELDLDGKLSYFNLDNLVNLKKLTLSGKIDKNFNFKLFKNLCNQLENIQIAFTNIDEKRFVKLFDGSNFLYLVKFSLLYFTTKRFKKEFISRFTMLRHLNISNCEIEIIEHDSFSDLQQLCLLNLSGNGIRCIEQNAFSMLKNLRAIDLSFNKIRYFQPKFIGLKESVELIIEHNMF